MYKGTIKSVSLSSSHGPKEQEAIEVIDSEAREKDWSGRQTVTNIVLAFGKRKKIIADAVEAKAAREKAVA